MDDRVVAKKEPAIMKLGPGTYYWCECGRSKGQPMCDGSHEGTGMKGVKFEIDKEMQVSLCQCKQTQDPPFCDGSHTKLPK